jgi:hypothetical protein
MNHINKGDIALHIDIHQLEKLFEEQEDWNQDAWMIPLRKRRRAKQKRSPQKKGRKK